MDAGRILENVRTISEEFAQARAERQQRRELAREDFDQLEGAGFLLTGVPVGLGDIWESPARSVRTISELLRTLAHGDSSVALASAMHPSVLSFWLASPDATAPYTCAWRQQLEVVFQSALDGAWWGTITSEAGNGGDLRLTRATAIPAPDGGYRLTGDKAFGSGSGITSYMMTVALPEGEDRPDLFYLDVHRTPWDGSTGMRLVAPWDGRGMVATQSHAFRFDGFPAKRSGWEGNLAGLGAAA
jgi:alkylation response protein AidB-like acyl-CoA dehydrogenase